MDKAPEPGPEDTPVNTSLKEAMKTCEILASALSSMNIAEVVETAKTPEEYKLVLEYKTQIFAMRTTAINSQAAVQDLRKNTSDETTAKALEEIEQGFDKFLTGIEGLLARVIEWIENYEHEPDRKDGDSAPAA
ncbi:uncharacterized protein ColSpa_07084 [Colletotrichum spaethianum]|uniref:Uncharacterized protein n=1 Tax=Colletotrichum spaethianum TaxID=700344 RepID=A0AA37LED8_9PEZI|nr:uncharacterized protein ColSpa_07084 [Colletotrichum spaethianum]GKT46903.1 hypothetical protein ColSpa_07084 [Colletotrichum spaethianum]